MNVYESDLIHLKNIGAASVNILHAVGIHSVNDLKKVGAVETYLRIKHRGINVSKVMLYALQGALEDTHWNDLSPQEKAELIEAAKTQNVVQPPVSVGVRQAM
ncbi:TfoX/Sxy family protein [Halioxenophilus sp. WMMB6]|uniref:TfoX/Sxy family protein n=1 Tax=Halioxenophilus sp. WMMB6 TaxID=3073815 RepID=UPI00295E4916|nr:TfoX/Sxy family protein [Halioxenophilus sp. WMMB6]